MFAERFVRTMTRSKTPWPLLVLPLLALIHFGCPEQRAGTLVKAQSIEAPDGRTRHFHYYRPETLIANPPVVFLLHGGSLNFNRPIDGNHPWVEWLDIADEEGILLIVPNGVRPDDGCADCSTQHWNDCRSDVPAAPTGADDVGFIDALIDWAAEKFDADLDRVYSTGASNGGMMSYRLAFELGDRIAAVVAFIANLPANSECTSPAEPVSVMIVNGSGESTWVPFDGGCVVDQRRCRHDVVESSDATRDFWIAHNNTDTQPSETMAYDDFNTRDDTTVSSNLFTGGDESTEVMYYVVENGGHTIPSVDHPMNFLIRLLLGNQNRDIEGARHAWNFLKRQRLSPTR